ncbi:DMT family transporter [Thalassococcus sp. S3]|uniref:DMT family transporter n=1 Tax=Thalassococcus sp. S3 TaxID=2017482 RepID=UPI0010248B70|nr:DMT family transporter [Thalassococcus sp. S3]QBF31601.1 EamA family transporter [Thalassococcus sp. S3]
MDNLKGAALMVLAMLGFAVEDALIKLMAGALPTWQIILVLGCGGSLVFALLTVLRGQKLLDRRFLTVPILIRNLSEMLGIVGFVTALSLIPLATASAILQAAPLLVTLGAALFLGEPVGWKRWSAILVGFAGVMLILRPGLDGFDANALFAVMGVVGLAARDVAVRRVPAEISSVQLSYLGFLAALPAAAILAAVTDLPYVAPPPWLWAALLATVGLGVFAYYCIVAASRIGEVAFVTPFRYSRMVFALAIGMVLFAERPDTLMMLGTTLIIASGLFTLWRERKHRRSA